MNLQAARSTPADAWLEVVTPHFTVDSDLPELAAKEVARNLEEERAALIEAAWTGARNPPRGRIDVVVFRTPGEFDRYSGRSAQVAGVAFTRPGFRRLLSFSPGGQNSIPTVVKHELAHDLSQWFLPIQPTWFAEGLATYLETTKYDPATHLAVMGEGSKSRLEWLVARRQFWPTADLFAAQSGIDLDPRVSALFYSSAWLFVYYLINAESDGFGEFQKRLARLQDWRQAWQESFPGATPELLDQRLMEYLKAGGNSTTYTTPVSLELAEPSVRPLSSAEMHGVLAWLTSNGDRTLAEREAAEALRLDANELRALVSRSRLLDNGAVDARLELAKRAIAAHPKSSDAWWLWARAQEPGQARRTALETALRLEPEHPGVLTLLADELVRQGRAADALAYTRLALQRSGLSYDLAWLHRQALVAQHQCHDASWLEYNAEQRFQANCTTTVKGVTMSCAQHLRDTWDSQTQLRACSHPASQTASTSAAEATRP